MQNQAAAERERMRRQTEMEIQEERRRTDERRAALERENMKARALAEAEGRIKEQRANEDIFARQIELRGEQQRQLWREAIETTFHAMGASMSSFLSNKEQMTVSLLGATALFAGFFGMREAARVTGRVVERMLGKPSLVRETSRSAGTFSLLRRMKRMLGTLPAEQTGLSGVVLRQEIAHRVKELSVATKNTKANGAPFRHMLFYGPPGTGKTMVAKRLARSSGLDYAIMSGGDVGPLGREAVTELHKLFDWSERSRRGLLLFIDEADAFLASRSRSAMSEDQRNALNAVLYRTGEASRNLMLVMATNRPGDLDTAVNDRVDEALIFDLPDRDSRVELLKIYFQQYIVDAGKDAKGTFFSKSAARIRVDDGFSDEYFEELANRTDGFSGRGIAKLMISVQGAVYGRQVPRLTKDIMEEIVDLKIKEHQVRKQFGASEEQWVGLDSVLHSAAEPTTKQDKPQGSSGSSESERS